MKLHGTSLFNQKKIAVFLHIIFLAVALAGFNITYFDGHYGKGLGWLTAETYEDTEAFSKKLRSDIDDVFSYIKYKKIFETRGEVDFSKPMARVVTGPGIFRTYTLDEMVRQAKSRGLYLDENFKITGQPPVDYERRDEELKVEWRAYDPNIQYSEPGDAYTTLNTLSEETLTHLGTYYTLLYKFTQSSSNFQYIVSYTNTDSDFENYSNVPGKSPDELKNLGKFLYVSGDSVYIESNLGSVPKNTTSLLEQHNPYDNSNYYMAAGVDTTYPVHDSYLEASVSYSRARVLYIAGLAGLILGLTGCLASLYFLILAAGHQESLEDPVALRGFDLVSTEGCILVFISMLYAGLFLGRTVGYRLLHLVVRRGLWTHAERLLNVVLVYSICAVFGFSLLRRYKAGALWKCSLTKKVISESSLYLNNRSFASRLAICYSCYLAFNVAAIAFAVCLFLSGPTLPARALALVLSAILIAADLWVFHRMLKNALETDQINEAVFQISGGDTSYKIDTGGFTGKEKELADNINHISSGLESAINEQVKSERLKADLITNVSHDIKTPLTSIINYVDLIKRERIPNERLQGYLEVLEQKSQRLKTLTEDLVEASKASSGNLKLDIADIDLVELVQQTNGEFEERFQARHLELVSGLPDEPVLIEADGRRLWRVLENLYNNAFKYAMERSRVYIDMETDQDSVIFTIKNISETPLNIHPDELTERFVRGDVSRTTEGSGLGLSIAKSLTELHGGEFRLFIDGDLFKAQLKFKRKELPEDGGEEPQPSQLPESGGEEPADM